MALKAKVARASASASTEKNQSKPWLFQPGQSGNPKGRPKGSRQVLGEDFLSALQADFKEHGPQTITKVREDRPHEYLKVVASILPKELNVKTDALNEMSDDDLASMLDAIRSTILAGVAAPARDRGETPSRH